MTLTAVASIGPWRIEPGPDGVALRRVDSDSVDPDWADLEFVPPQGSARRVVLLGESTARGWPYEAHLSPTSVLQRHLAGFQCLDLAKVGANAADLLATAAATAHLSPSVIVSLAGNNWMLSPPMAVDAGGCGGSGLMDADDGVAAALAAGLRSGGYPGMRRAFVAHVLAEVRAYVDRLLAARSATGAQVIMVIPEFDLTGFTSSPELDVPVLPHTTLTRWYTLRAQAEAILASTGRRRALVAVAGIAADMAELDGGCSPVPGRLTGMAALTLGVGAAARAAFEQSRDSVMGLLVRETPRVTREIQDVLETAATEHGFACVDLRRVLARQDLPDLSDEAYFHDYCHLSDLGIERAAAAIADAVLDLPAGSVRPGPGAPPLVRAFAHARAAAHLAFLGQPAATITRHLRASVDAEPAIADTLTDVRDVLAARRPAWAHPAAQRLSADPRVAQFVPVLAASEGLHAGLWTLRECLDDVLGPSVIDEQHEVDLLAPPTTDGHPLPNWAPPRSHHVACSSASVLAFALPAPASGTLTVTHRSRFAPDGTVTVTCNDVHLAGLPASPTWTTIELPLPPDATRPGVNWLRIRWPIPNQNVELAHNEDAEALDRGEFPQVLPIFGELHEARLDLD